MAEPGLYDRDLDRTQANYAPLTPLSLLRRTAATYPDKTAVVHGARRFSYAEFEERCRRLAGALAARGIGRGDTVAVLAPNVPALLEAHYGVPMTGAVLNALNTRLDAATVGFILAHAEAKILIADREFAEVVATALEGLETTPLVVEIDDPEWPADAATPGRLSDVDYEAFLADGDPGFEPIPPEDEWDAICLNYTSGTTGNPKGVVYHHRGAYLNALGNLITFGLTPASVYLWTLPMFHCNGWTFTWAVTAAAGTHVCLRRVDPALIYPLIRDERVTHLCGAPIVLNLLIHAPEETKLAFPQTVEVATGGAAPPSAVIEAMEAQGFRVTHMYGLTESYGPATVCAWQSDWEGLDLQDRSGRMARQGVALPTLEQATVRDPETLAAVPADGETLGEIMLRGNTVMKGYLKNPKATEGALADGWFRTGDLAVLHPDGYIEVKDRAKDVIISGGENISSLEVEEVLFRHPKVMEAAVVARPDPTWGETPCAFVALKAGAEAEAEEIIAFCKENMARFKAPRSVVFGPLPKTSTGKIQKFELRERARKLS